MELHSRECRYVCLESVIPVHESLLTITKGYSRYSLGSYVLVLLQLRDLATITSKI